MQKTWRAWLAALVVASSGCGDGDSSADGGGGPSPPAARGAATLTWLPPTQNSDGSVLNDLAGYKVYWGQSPWNLNRSVTLDNAGLTSYVVEDLAPATWYFATTAFDRDGNESERSNLAWKTIR